MDYSQGIVRRKRIIPPSQSFFSNTGGGAGGVTWTAPTTHVSLSGGNLVVTAISGAVIGDGARSSTSHSTGKYYFEVTYTTDPGTPGTIYDGVGVIGSTFTLGGGVGLGDVNAIGYYGPGDHYGGGASLGSWVVTTGPTTGDVWCIAVDLDFRKTWARKNNDIWVDDPTWDPATNIGGDSISALDSSVYLACELRASGAVLTANFAGPFTYTAPSGFVVW